MRLIELTKGKYAKVDDDDYDHLNQWNWFYTGGYAARSLRIGVRSENRILTVRMHRFIMQAPDGMNVDHKNGDTLDNRRCNLRLCTHSQNTQNARKNKAGCFSSQYKGVRTHTAGLTWESRIRGKTIGTFDVEEDAARAYDRKAIELFGEFASLNFPLEEYI